MTSGRIAFVIPLDIRRHAKFISNLEFLVGEFSDVYIILTKSSGFEYWKKEIKSSPISPITLSDHVPLEDINQSLRRRGIITFKKWLGARLVMSLFQKEKQYNYLITCDCELKLIRPIDKDFIDALPSQFNFVGDHPSGKYMDWRRFDKGSEYRQLPLELECENINTWWSGLPLYDTSTLLEFLDHVGINDTSTLAKTIGWDNFDHLIYQRYLVACGLHGARYICLTHDLKTPTGWSLEGKHITLKSIEASEEAGLQTLWINNDVYQKYPEYDSGAYLIFHIDRKL